jgi:Lar family restriction alleviation protein
MYRRSKRQERGLCIMKKWEKVLREAGNALIDRIIESVGDYREADLIDDSCDDSKMWKDCPFCGAVSVVAASKQKRRRSGEKRTQWFIYCQLCSARGSAGCSEDEALEKWNLRDKRNDDY